MTRLFIEQPLASPGSAKKFIQMCHHYISKFMKKVFLLFQDFLYKKLLILSNIVILNSKASKKVLLQKRFLIEVHIDFESSILNLIQISLNKFLFPVLGFHKRIAIVYFLRPIEGICFWKAKLKNKNLLRLIWFKVPVTCRTLHTAHCKVHTGPEPVPAPESAPVQFILRIDQCTMHTTHLYCMHLELVNSIWRWLAVFILLLLIFYCCSQLKL